MLTQADLSAIEKVLDPRFTSIENRLAGIEKNLSEVGSDVEGIKDQIKDVNKTLREHGNDLRTLKRDTKKIRYDLEETLGHLDAEDIKLKKRVIRIEDHLHLAA